MLQLLILSLCMWVVYIQVEGVQDMASMTMPNIDTREELYDPLSVPDVDKYCFFSPFQILD